MGRIIKKEVSKPIIKKVSSNQITKPLSKEELIQRRRETQKFYSQMSLNRVTKEVSPARSKMPTPSVPNKNVVNRVSTTVKKTAKVTTLPARSASASSLSRKSDRLAVKSLTKKETPLSSKNNFEFKSSSTSLQMIKSGNINIGNTGRLSMKQQNWRKGEAPRFSLLPLGINVFDKNTSDADKQKVYDFMRNQNGEDTRRSSIWGTPGRNRLVRFQIEDAISENNEKFEQEIPQSPIELNPVVVVSENSAIPAPQSILKKKKRLSKASQDFIAQSSTKKTVRSVVSDENKAPIKLILSSSEESGNEQEEFVKPVITPKRRTLTFSDSSKPIVANAHQFYSMIMDNQFFFQELNKTQLNEIKQMLNSHMDS